MSLNDLFSAESPPPPPRAQEESLFLSPGTPLASQRSNRSRTVRSESPVSPSHSRIRRRARSSSRARQGSVDAHLNPLSNRHGYGVLHARANGREIDVVDDPFVAQDPLGPGPLTHGKYAVLPSADYGSPSAPPRVNRYGSDGAGPAGAADPLMGLGMGGDDDDGAEPAKKRRKMAKVDHERLLAPQGLPRLMKIAKAWKVRGKGKEKEDLGLLIDMYTVWAHGMFPKGDFKYTIGRVEAVCRTNRMINSISGMKETFYHRPSASPDPASPSAQDIPDAADFGDFGDEEMGGVAEDMAALESQIMASQPGLSGIPLFTPLDLDEGDEDELAALAEAEAAAEAEALAEAQALSEARTGTQTGARSGKANEGTANGGMGDGAGSGGAREEGTEVRRWTGHVDMGDAPPDITEEDEW